MTTTNNEQYRAGFEAASIAAGYPIARYSTGEYIASVRHRWEGWCMAQDAAKHEASAEPTAYALLRNGKVEGVEQTIRGARMWVNADIVPLVMAAGMAGAEVAAGSAETRMDSGFDASEPVGSLPDEAKNAARLLTAIVRSDIGIATRHKLEDGQGTNTDDGKAWQAAIDFVAAIEAHTKAGGAR